MSSLLNLSRYGEDGQPISDAFVIGIAGVQPFLLSMDAWLLNVVLQADLQAARYQNWLDL